MSCLFVCVFEGFSLASFFPLFFFFVLYDEIYLLTNSFASGCGVNQFFGRPVREAFYDAVKLI
jgi:hypothetical protein